MRHRFSFYRETDFKETPIGRIPNDWTVVKLEKVISAFENGIWGDAPVQGDKSHPIIRSTEITHDGKIDLSTVSFRRVASDKLEKYSLAVGDILLVGSSGSSKLIGRAALFTPPSNAVTCLFSNFMVRIRPKGIDSRFLYYFLSSPNYYHFLRRLQQTSTGLRNLPRKEFIKMRLPFPSALEQQKIAEILSIVDEAIQKTSEVIAKTERLKKGLMRELLTQGIGHKEFKHTEIGRIPKEWEAVKLGEIFSLEYGKGLSEKERVEGKYPVCGSNGIIGYHKQFLVNGPGIVVGRKGTMGAVSWIDSDFWPIDTTYFVKVSRDDVSLEWLFYKLVHIDLKKLTLSDVVPGLKRSLVYPIRIGLPLLSEQQETAEILSAFDKKLEIERNEKTILERIKQGLVDLLLTGKIRVRVESDA